MQQLAVGFIGAGTIARYHAERVRDLGHDAVAVADIAPNARTAFVDEFGIPAQYEDYERMLDEENLDVVCVAVPNALHALCAVAALERDVNAFVEKPLADTLENAQRIATAEATSDATVMVGFKKAFEASTEIVLDGLAAGKYGDLYEVNMEMIRRRGVPQIGSWFTRKDVSGGGAIVDIGPHMLHLALQLLDFPAVKSVSATAGAHFGSDPDYTYLSMWGGDPVGDRAFDVEDHARALIRTHDGPAIHLNATWATNRAGHEQVQVLGSRAGATFTPHENTVVMHSIRHDSLVDEELTKPEVDSFRAEWEYFAAVLTGEREHNLNTVEQGVAVQEIIEAAYESADRDAEVTIAEL